MVDMELREVRSAEFGSVIARGFDATLTKQDFNAETWDHTIDMLVTKWHHEDMADTLEASRKRITARISKDVRDTLEQAAELLGATVNQFIVQTAYMEAQRVIERESVIRLSQKDAQKIFSLLDNPPKANKRLKDAAKAFKTRVRE